MKSIGLPLPIIGNALPMIKQINNFNKYMGNPIAEAIESEFNKDVPPVHTFFLYPFKPLLIFNDPLLVNEIYVTKNKYVDKEEFT